MPTDGAVGGLPDVLQAHDRLRERRSTQRRNRRLVIGAGIAASLAAAVVAAAVGVALLTGDDRASRLEPLPPATAPPRVPETSVGTSVPLPAAAIAMRGKVAALPARHNLAFAGALWSIARSGTSLLRIDAASGRTTATVPLALPAGMVAEAITTTGDGPVVTAAPPGHAVQGESETNAAYLLIDPASGSVGATVRVKLDVGQDGNRVAYGDSGTWVQSGPQEIGQLDRQAFSIARRVTIGRPVNGLAVARKAVWVASFDAGVTTRVDVESGRTSTVETGSGTSIAGAGTWFSAGFVWRNGTVIHVEGDPPFESARLTLDVAKGGKADIVVPYARLACVCGGQLTVTERGLTAPTAYDVPGVDADTSIASGFGTADGQIWLLTEDGTLLGLNMMFL